MKGRMSTMEEGGNYGEGGALWRRRDTTEKELNERTKSTRKQNSEHKAGG